MPNEFDDLHAIGDPRRLVHLNMTEALRRYRYQELRQAGHTCQVARRCRDWHTRDYNGILDIAPNNFQPASIQPSQASTLQTDTLPPMNLTPGGKLNS